MARIAQFGTSGGARSNHHRAGSTETEKKEIWSTLLDNVASEKGLPKKHLIVLGGTEEQQRDFISSLSQDPPKNSRQRQSDRSAKNKKTPIANQYALGYTYLDVYDAEHEDVLARLSIHTLSEPSAAYAPLLRRLLAKDTVPNTAVAILLDWAEPWHFLRNLKAWVRLLRTVVNSLPADVDSLLDDNAVAWQKMRDSEALTSITDSRTSMPLGPGEFDEPLGLPAVVVCQNALAIETLEKERGFRESHFDFISQTLRTVLLKHGAGLIYTMPSQPSQLQPLVHSMLDIGSGFSGTTLAGRGEKAERPVQHNVVDRDRVVVPPGWDSWGKIRVLREGFDVEGFSRAWSVDIQPEEPANNGTSPGTSGATSVPSDQVLVQSIESDPQQAPSAEDESSTVYLYEAQIQDPRPPETNKPGIEVQTTPDQTFLAAQLEQLEVLRAEDEAAKKQQSRRTRGTTSSAGHDDGGRAMADQIGPVQFNVGGIQYDADEALRRIKVCTAMITTRSEDDID